MAGKCHSCSHVGAVLWKLEHAVRSGLTGIACTDESAQWNRGTTRNVVPMAISNITFKKPKVGENILDNNDDYVPSIRETPLYTSDEKFKAEVRNSALFKLFDIKGTTVNKSFTCTPIARSIMQENHGEHVSLSSCRKCYNFYTNNIMLCTGKVKTLEQGTKSQSSSILWRDARKVRLTASSASKVPVKDTTDATTFIREHLQVTNLPDMVPNKNL